MTTTQTDSRELKGCMNGLIWIDAHQSIKLNECWRSILFMRSSITAHTAALWIQRHTHTHIWRGKGSVHMFAHVCFSCHFITARCWQGSSAPVLPLGAANGSLWHLEKLIISGSHMHTRSSMVCMCNITDSNIRAFSSEVAKQKYRENTAVFYWLYLAGGINSLSLYIILFWIVSKKRVFFSTCFTL